MQSVSSLCLRLKMQYLHNIISLPFNPRMQSVWIEFNPCSTFMSVYKTRLMKSDPSSWMLLDCSIGAQSCDPFYFAFHTSCVPCSFFFYRTSIYFDRIMCIGFLSCRLKVELCLLKQYVCSLHPLPPVLMYPGPERWSGMLQSALWVL